MTIKPGNDEKVSRLAHLVLLSIVFGLGFTTLHCNARPTDLRPEERLAAVEKMYAEYQEGFPDVPEVEPETVAQALESNAAVVVDVREPREWAVSHIPGAIPVEAFEQDKMKYKDRPIIAYCTIGYRSGQFAKRLTEEGFNASNLRGSILGWVHAGEPVVNDKGETKQVHVFGPQWDLLPEGYESIW